MKPELRPAAPSAIRPASSTMIRAPGCNCFSRRAADSPANPAPMMTKSAVVSLVRGVAGGWSGKIALHAAGPRWQGRRLA